MGKWGMGYHFHYLDCSLLSIANGQKLLSLRVIFKSQVHFLLMCLSNCDLSTLKVHRAPLEAAGR